MTIRDATADDAAAIAAIYNHFILHSSISFEEEPVPHAVMAQRIADVHALGLPWLAVDDHAGTLLGYAYATRWRVRRAYRHSVETSVYLHRDAAGRGLGAALYGALLQRLRACGCHLAIGGIAQPNPASVALHEKMGFEQVAMFREVGFKFGRWIDVGYWQLTLD